MITDAADKEGRKEQNEEEREFGWGRG